MRFNTQRFFVYEKTFFHGHTLESLFKGPESTDNELFNLSGLRDLKEVLLLQQEHMRQYPTVDVKELRRAIGENTTSIDWLYNEPLNMIREFNRVIPIPAYIEQGEEKWGLGKGGRYSEQDTKFVFHILDLFQKDWFPYPGDDVFYAGNNWTILYVNSQPVNYFQQSGLPCYIECETKQLQYGDIINEPNALSTRSRYDQPAIFVPSSDRVL